MVADYYSAQDACSRFNANLAAIHSQAEQDFINQLMLNQDLMWIGLRLEDWTNSFSWLDNTRFNFENWEKKKSDNKTVRYTREYTLFSAFKSAMRGKLQVVWLAKF